jgi:hypothetical protein
MKKIYSKFTKDRVRQFQIETYIAQGDHGRCVAKRALNPEAAEHIAKMREYYENHKSSGLLCEAGMEEADTITFPFLEGKSLCKEMLEALSGRQKDVFLEKLQVYRDILNRSAGEKTVSGEELSADPDFVRIFGQQKLEGTMASGADLDIDLTFDNIIHDQADGAYKLIDYEWFFPFQVPVNYIVYRALWAFHFKYANVMNDVVTLLELYESFQIRETDVAVFEDMNRHFDIYVYGESGAHRVLEKYKKTVYDVRKLLPEENLFLQIFVNDGKNYREDMATTIPLSGSHVELKIPMLLPEEMTVLRIDPVNVSCVLENLKVIVETSDGAQTTVQEYAHNAISFSENKYAFCSEDPQLLIENIWEGKMTCLYVSFDILQVGLLENPLREGVENVHKTMQEIIERKDDELIGKEKELVNMHKIVEGKEKELIDMQIKMKRLQDELNLIKASRIYQNLLQKKIDKLMEELP